MEPFGTQWQSLINSQKPQTYLCIPCNTLDADCVHSQNVQDDTVVSPILDWGMPGQQRTSCFLKVYFIMETG